MSQWYELLEELAADICATVMMLMIRGNLLLKKLAIYIDTSHLATLSIERSRACLIRPKFDLNRQNGR